MEHKYEESMFEKIETMGELGEMMVRPSITYWADSWRRLKTNKVAMGSIVILFVLIVMCIFAPMFSKYNFEVTDTSSINLGPSSLHIFGTDSLGRDIFTRVWVGGRVSIMIGFVGTLMVICVGCVYGGIAGYFGGKIDHYMMRVIEILVSIPYLVMVILISLYLGKGIFALIIALTITGWTEVARIVRGQVLQIKEQEFVTAAKALGASPSRIILKHLLPNTVGVVIVAITFKIPGFIFAEAFLSFIGLGVQAPNTSWGALAAAARENLRFYPYQIFFPSLMIILTMLSFSLLGDGLRDALDPKERQ
ncbi:oligopeptide transport system permease protein [Cetobacterium ceti]|uniref:Oligopeptide transport system permease protein n=1 Tax=Cetobacterium ceti TaxID=180163 RepID=A0A1T4LWW0_9FUSO|nr:ABC transporter permease [Cetobacterium ceti]SJZ59240.1 oligopeptide transport system permease protein [Cetobacterium ceti]